ncbi:hypothetical protein HK405_009994, partial [Cladochytrium tenue]
MAIAAVVAFVAAALVLCVATAAVAAGPVRRAALLLRALHAALRSTLLHELLNVPPGDLPPPPELLLARARERSHLDDAVLLHDFGGATTTIAVTAAVRAAAAIEHPRAAVATVWRLARAPSLARYAAMEAAALAVNRRLRGVRAAELAVATATPTPPKSLAGRDAASDATETSPPPLVSAWSQACLVIVVAPPFAAGPKLRE